MKNTLTALVLMGTLIGCSSDDKYTPVANQEPTIHALSRPTENPKYQISSNETQSPQRSYQPRVLWSLYIPDFINFRKIDKFVEQIDTDCFEVKVDINQLKK